MDTRAKELIEQGDQLFQKRTSLMSLWQEISDQFYVERADFTTSRSQGDVFADHLTTSYPLLARRDLGNAFSAMLRPTQKEWFRIHAADERREDDAAKLWLDQAAKVQRKAMYDRRSQFIRATKEGDHDFAAFGQCVLSIELNRHANGLLYRCWHLRDVVWCENVDGAIDTVHRRWKPTARDLKSLFPGKVASEIETLIAQKKPYEEVEVRHSIIPGDSYDLPNARRKGAPFVSVYTDVKHQKIMEEVPLWQPHYVIPRWQTVSGSQYAYSPATVAALPDARLIQDMTRVLLEAGEKAVNPPMIAVQEAIRSDVAIYAGGITWADAEYDERLGEALRPLAQKTDGIPLGLEMSKDVREMIASAFFLNKLSPILPTQDKQMTAYEAAQRVSDYIRNALPLFEPMESDYNGQVCDGTFELLLQAGVFGSPRDMPPSLRGADVQFRFESPLNEAIEAQKAGKLQAAMAIIAQCVGIDPSAGQRLDVDRAEVDSLRGIGVPEDWLRSDDQLAAIKDSQARRAAAAQLLAGVGQGAQITKTLGEASQAFAAGQGQQAAA